MAANGNTTAVMGDQHTAAEQHRSRQFNIFNRRGRIAENLDMLWAEVSQLRQQQSEIRTLLEQILRQQQLQLQQQSPQQQQPQLRAPASAGPGSASSGGGGGGGGLMRGAAALPAERPASGQVRGQGPWQWGQRRDD